MEKNLENPTHQEEILEGKFQPPTSDPKTKELFQAMQFELTKEERKIDLQIDQKVFQDFCKRVRENKGSSPLGRHCGHYKALLNGNYLMSVIFSVIEFSLQTNYVPDRWKTLYHKILEKVQNSPKNHKL